MNGARTTREWIDAINKAKLDQGNIDVPLILEKLSDKSYGNGQYSPVYITNDGVIFPTSLAYNTRGIAEREGHIRAHDSNGKLKLVAVVLRFFGDWLD